MGETGEVSKRVDSCKWCRRTAWLRGNARPPIAEFGPDRLGILAYQSICRRDRSQRFSELRGQDHVTFALTSAVANDRVGHAYLSSDPLAIEPGPSIDVHELDAAGNNAATRE